MSHKKEEDFDASLAGEEGTAEQNKANWFKRMKKGILTSTKDKKMLPKDYGLNAPPANTPVRFLNWPRINLFAPNANTTTVLAVRNILRSCLMITNTPSFLPTSFLRII